MTLSRSDLLIRRVNHYTDINNVTTWVDLNVVSGFLSLTQHDSWDLRDRFTRLHKNIWKLGPMDNVPSKFIDINENLVD